MRSKKPILLYCADQKLLPTMAFALRLHPYDVAAVHDGRDAIKLTKGDAALFACCVLIHAHQADPAGPLIHRLLKSPSRVPVLLVDRAGDLAPAWYAEVVLYGRNTTMSHVLAALRVLVKTRPGSKHGRTG